MSLSSLGIQQKQFGGYPITSIRANISARNEIDALIEEIKQALPEEDRVGPFFMVRHFIHSYTEGSDFEIGIRTKRLVNAGRVQTRDLPLYQVLAVTHQGSLDTLGETYGKLFGLQDIYGVISDEFCFEVFLDGDNPTTGAVEALFVLHEWEKLFSQHLEHHMGEIVRDAVMEGEESIRIDMPVQERFDWAKEVVHRLDQVSDDFQRYDVLSNCAHVYPAGQVVKLQAAYQQSFQQHGDMLTAVDAVLDFIDGDPGWPQGQRYREGNIIYISKRPRDREAYAKATTDLERKKAACFCPIIRNQIDQGMSPTFCYCSSGFERQQWEVAIGQPVKIDVVRSLLKGDEVCEFALHLPGE